MSIEGKEVIGKDVQRFLISALRELFPGFRDHSEVNDECGHAEAVRLLRRAAELAAQGEG